MITIVTKPVFWTQIMLKDVTVFYNVCGPILISWNSTTAIHVSQSSRIFCLIYTVYERKNMRKLALSDEILLKVDKAARYIGGEVNSSKFKRKYPGKPSYWLWISKRIWSWLSSYKIQNYKNEGFPKPDIKINTAEADLIEIIIVRLGGENQDQKGLMDFLYSCLLF